MSQTEPASLGQAELLLLKCELFSCFLFPLFVFYAHRIAANRAARLTGKVTSLLLLRTTSDPQSETRVRAAPPKSTHPAGVLLSFTLKDHAENAMALIDDAGCEIEPAID